MHFLPGIVPGVTAVMLTELSAEMLYIIITTLLGNVADGVFAVL